MVEYKMSGRNFTGEDIMRVFEHGLEGKFSPKVARGPEYSLPLGSRGSLAYICIKYMRNKIQHWTRLQSDGRIEEFDLYMGNGWVDRIMEVDLDHQPDEVNTLYQEAQDKSYNLPDHTKPLDGFIPKVRHIGGGVYKKRRLRKSTKRKRKSTKKRRKSTKKRRKNTRRRRR